MTAHVDLIENQWLARKQRILATVTVANGRVEMSGTRGTPELREMVSNLMRDVDISNPDGFLEELHRRLSGTYLFASEPHRAGDCPYNDDDELELPLRRVAGDRF